MKAKTKLISLLIALPFFFISCQKSELIDESKSADPVVTGSDNLKSGIVYCGTPLSANLVDFEETIIAGIATIGNDSNKLYVSYELTDDWWIQNAILFVGPASEAGTIHPDGSGNFTPWEWVSPYRHNFFPMDLTQTHTFEIDLNTLDDCFVVVAYINSKNLTTNENKYIWGKSELKCDGYYIDYCKQDCEPPPLGGCETAFAFGGDIANCFLGIKKDGTLNPNGPPSQNFNRWGWTNGPIDTGTYDMEIWAAAGQCDHTNGTLVGTLTVDYDELTGTATITYIMDPGYVMDETHLYVGNNILPMKKNKYTVAPGQYPYIHDGLNGVSSDTYIVDGLSGDIYVVGHAVVCDEE